MSIFPDPYQLTKSIWLKIVLLTMDVSFYKPISLCIYFHFIFGEQLWKKKIISLPPTDPKFKHWVRRAGEIRHFYGVLTSYSVSYQRLVIICLLFTYQLLIFTLGKIIHNFLEWKITNLVIIDFYSWELYDQSYLSFFRFFPDKGKGCGKYCRNVLIYLSMHCNILHWQIYFCKFFTYAICLM